jgi:hypothetical protein
VPPSGSRLCDCPRVARPTERALNPVWVRARRVGLPPSGALARCRPVRGWACALAALPGSVAAIRRRAWVRRRRSGQCENSRCGEHDHKCPCAHAHNDHLPTGTPEPCPKNRPMPLRTVCQGSHRFMPNFGDETCPVVVTRCARPSTGSSTSIPPATRSACAGTRACPANGFGRDPVDTSHA